MTITKKIGNTMYKVSVNFSKTSKENIEDKILRLAKTDLSSGKIYDIMKLPQTGLLLEGGSL